MNGNAVILIVDDRSANLLALENLLGSEDRTILTAATGRDALKIVLENSVDLIILDVKMPDMDGFEVAQILKMNNRTKDIPIIFATAHHTEHQSMMKGFEEGAVDYLLKPLHPDTAKAKVNVYLKLQLQKRELVEKNRSLEIKALQINNAADIVMVADAGTSLIEEVNPAFTKITGYSAQEAIGKEMTFLLHDTDKSVLSEFAQKTAAGAPLDTMVCCKDNTCKWLQWKIVAKYDKWFINARDISEIKQLNEKLQGKVEELLAANSELESFSYSVSHDLRAPLRAIAGYSTILTQEQTTADEDTRRMLEKIKYNASRMGTLIDDLLDFSRLGRKEVRRHMVDNNAIVQQVMTEMAQITPPNARIMLAPLPDVYADPSLIKQVWVNLISNAFKYSAGKEVQEIEIAFADGAYYVRDNGAGFDMRYMDKLFGVFQRLHTSREFEGTGIGLAIVRRIIEKHGGRIWANAEVDKGATFYFTLPKMA